MWGGRNISEKNPYYCELTAGYWVAENDKTSDYLGLYHYSRGLDLTDTELELRLCGDDVVIVPYPYMARYSMASRVHRLDCEIIRKAVISVNPDYEESVEAYFSQSFFIPANIMIASKGVFREYYKWLMNVLEQCDRLFGNTYDIAVPKRLWGYYGEHLQNIFLIYHRGEYSISFSKMKDMTI